jgi:MerR family transcriptional regulator/heat shock protein HspR
VGVGRGAAVTDAGRPLYLIGVVADMLRIHPQTLRLYERKGLIRPSRTVGRTRMYSSDDVEDIRRILRLTRDLGVNLAGVEIILKMRRQMLLMQEEIEQLTSHVRQEGGAGRERAGEDGALVRVANRGLQKIDVF